jgi:hypothetical protein
MLSTYRVSAEVSGENESDQQLRMEVKREVEKGCGRALMWVMLGSAIGRSPRGRGWGRGFLQAQRTAEVIRLDGGENAWGGVPWPRTNTRHGMGRRRGACHDT